MPAQRGDQPARALRAPGVLLTGHPSSGKSTLAVAVARRLAADGIDCEVLDGDELRARLPPALGFSRADRAAQFQRALYVAELLSAHGVIPILALVAPFAADRALAGRRFAPTGWIEVFLDPPLEVCLQRDSRGLYAALNARGGRALIEAEVLAVYEPPADATLRLDTSRIELSAATDQIVELVQRRLDAPPG